MSIEELYSIFKNSSGVTTDTRNIKKNQLFFALKGEKFNANEYAENALTAGACYAVVDEMEYSQNPNCILVDNVLKTLQDLAQYHRSTFKIPIIGLTGSNGKTTNKELLALVLGCKYKVHATKGNLNNHIGVPLTLLEMPLDTDIAIIEMGANHQQEIAMLSEICRPNYGFITNIGKAHLEGFGGPEGVKKGKGELFDFLKRNNEIAFINESDTVLKQMAIDKAMMQVVYYGKDNNALTLTADSPVIVFSIPDNERQYISQISGTYNFENMQTAYAIGKYFGVDNNQSAEAIVSYNPTNNRSQIVVKNGNTFHMDAYNANPSSMAASISNFINLETNQQKIVILGDMFELGEYAQKEHEDIGKLVASGNFSKQVLFGENMKHALPFLPQAFYFTDKFSLHNWLMDSQFADTCFLIKGSRSVGLESILTIM